MINDERTSGAADPGAPAAGEVGSSAWSRPAVTFRLTDARKNALLSLLPRDAADMGPTAALDRAIVLATDAAEGESASGHGLSSDWPFTAESLRGIREDMGAALSGIAAVAADIAALREEMARAAGLDADEPGNPSASPAAGEPPSLRDWLRLVVAPESSWAIVEARPRRERRAGPAMPFQELDVRLLSSEAAPKAEATGASTVLLDFERLDGAAPSLELCHSMVLQCRRTGGGWSVAARAVKDGKLGAPIAMLKI